MTGATASRRAAPRRELAEFAKGGLIGLAGSATAAIAGFTLTIAVARVLGPAQTGVFFVVVSLINILGQVAELGADTGTLRTAARLRAVGRTGDLRASLLAALGPVLLVSVAVATALYLLAGPVAGVFTDGPHRDQAVQFIRIAAPFLAVAGARSVALAGARGLGNIAGYSLIGNVAMPAARPLLVLAGWLLGFGGGAVMLAWSVPAGAAFVAAAVLLWRLLRDAEREPRASEPVGGAAVFREFWRFTGPRGVAATIEMAIVWVDVLIVSALVSTADAGVYATASRFITSGTLVLAATRIAVAPQIAGLLARGERRRAEDLNAVATSWVVLGSWPLYLALACFGPFVLRLFGKDFTGGAGALAVLSIAMLLVLAAGNVQTVLLMGGKSTWSLANKVAALGVMVALDFVLVPAFGIVGAAVAWAVAMLVDTVAAVWQVRRLLGLRLEVRGSLAVGGLAVGWFGGLGLAGHLLLGDGAPVFAGYLVVACAGYGCGLWLMRGRLQMAELLAAVRSRGAPQNAERDDEDKIDMEGDR